MEGPKRAFLFDAHKRQVATMPTPTNTFLYGPSKFDPGFKYKPKPTPKFKPMRKPSFISLFVPSASGSDPDPDADLFLLERYPQQEPERSVRPESEQFGAFVYRRTSKTSPSKSWSWQLLEPPPYLRDAWYWYRYTKIMSYGVVGGGSHICISVSGVGTYCMDTVSHTWAKVGEWMLPFRGKFEYVPELKLWFGLSDSDRDQRLVAADLSDMDSGPDRS